MSTLDHFLKYLWKGGAVKAAKIIVAGDVKVQCRLGVFMESRLSSIELLIVFGPEPLDGSGLMLTCTNRSISYPAQSMVFIWISMTLDWSAQMT
jgi:hypothetical protein